MIHDTIYRMFEYKMLYTRYFAISLLKMDIHRYIPLYIFKMLQLAVNAIDLPHICVTDI